MCAGEGGEEHFQNLGREDCIQMGELGTPRSKTKLPGGFL